MRALTILVVAMATATLTACTGDGPGPGTNPDVPCPDGECPATMLTIDTTFNGDPIDCVVFQDGEQFARTNESVEIEPNTVDEYTVGDPASEPTSDGVPTHTLGNGIRVACPPIRTAGDIGEDVIETCIMNYVFTAEASCQFDSWLWDENAPDNKGEFWATDYADGVIDVTSNGELDTNVFEGFVNHQSHFAMSGDQFTYSTTLQSDLGTVTSYQIDQDGLSFTKEEPNIGVIEANCQFTDFY